MEMQKEEAKMLQWHPAFFAEIQIELQEDAEHLIFENEHQLGTKPKEIDVLIIKKDKGRVIRKNIGRIFRQHNIVATMVFSSPSPVSRKITYSSSSLSSSTGSKT